MNVFPFPTNAVTLKDGHPITTSLAVASIFEKQHKDVLRAIRNVECSEDFNRRNFTPRDYIDDRGKAQPMIELTQDGWIMVVMGFTGPEAVRVKEEYIAAFNRMRETIENKGSQIDALEEMFDRILGAGRQTPPAPAFFYEHRPQPAPSTIAVDLYEYLALLKDKIAGLEAGKKAPRPAPVPLSEAEKQHIMVLHTQGKATGEIMAATGRSRSAVRNLIRERA